MRNSKIVAIIQARMTSTRLPGKVMMDVCGIPLIEYQIKRMTNSKLIDQVVIATTINREDDVIVKWAEQHKLSVYRGSEDDVLARYIGAATEVDADIIVRITSDCPLIDATVVDGVITEFLRHHEVDYVSNTLTRSYPRGLDTEVFTYKALKQAHEEALTASDREHVTPYLYLNREQFIIREVISQTDYSRFRITVDTEDDLKAVSQIISHFGNEIFSCDYMEIIALLQNRPDIVALNKDVEQKRI